MEYKQKLIEFEKRALNAYCEQSESVGFIFTSYENRVSKDEENGYCVGFQNGYKEALVKSYDSIEKEIEYLAKDIKQRYIEINGHLGSSIIYDLVMSLKDKL